MDHQATCHKTKKKITPIEHPSISKTPSARIHEYFHAGFKFDVIDTGPLTGEPIILLHGFPERANSWQKVSEILNAEGYRTLALEQRGYSLSAAPRGRFQYALSALVEDVKALVDLIGMPVYMVGHDWGSMVASEYALTYPQDLKHLSLISVPHKAAYIRALFTTSQFFSSYYVAFFQLPILPEIMFKHIAKLRTFFLHQSGMTAQQITHFEQDFIHENRLSTAINWYRSLILSSPTTLFNKVHVPTLFVWGDKDIAINHKCAALNADYFTQEYKAVFLNATHWIPNQNAEDFCQHFLTVIQK